MLQLEEVDVCEGGGPGLILSGKYRRCQEGGLVDVMVLKEGIPCLANMDV